MAFLNGQIKYSYDADYLGITPTAQVFTQDYLANLSGPVLEDRIGSYQLGFQYQRGITELRNLTFSNTLNFRDYLRVTASLLRKDLANIYYGYNPVADNRFSVLATTYIPNLPSLTIGFEQGDSRSASGEGTNKYDKRGEIGLNYNFAGNTISTRYIKKTLNDDTYSNSRLANRNELFTFYSNTNIGNKAHVNSNFSDQRIFNSVGSSSRYNQRLQNLKVAGSVQLSERLTVGPEFSSVFNHIDYDLPTNRMDVLGQNQLGIVTDFRPTKWSEFSFDLMSGAVGINDLSGDRKQSLNSQKAGVRLSPAKDLLAVASIKNEDYDGSGLQGKAIYANSYLGYPLEAGARLTYRRALTYIKGNILSLSSLGVGKKDSHDFGLEVFLPNNFYLSGTLTYSVIDSYDFRGIGAGLRYSAGGNSFEIRRDSKAGKESAQIINSTTNMFKANIAAGNLNLSEQISFIDSKTILAASIKELNGFRSNTEVNYSVGNSLIRFIMNSERRDKDSSVYTRSNLSFTRYF